MKLLAALLAAGCMPAQPVDVGPLRDALAGKMRPETQAIAKALPPALVTALGAARWDQALTDDPDFQQGLDVAALALQDYYAPPPPPPSPAVEECDCDQVLLIVENAVQTSGATLVSFTGAQNPGPNRPVIAAALQVAIEAARLKCEHLPSTTIVGAINGCRACTDTSRCAGAGESTNVGLKSQCCPGLMWDGTHCVKPNQPLQLGCGGRGFLCTTNGQCCSQQCKSDGMCQGRLSGEECGSNNDCATNLCSGNRCVCVPECGRCAAWWECCTHRCDTRTFQCTA